MITQERLKEVLYYHPESGDWVRLLSDSTKPIVSRQAGTLRPDGYITVAVDGKHYLAHRLAVLYMTGVFPSDEVDHENRIKHDNTWDNLRPATHEQNQHNVALRVDNDLGIKNIHWNAKQQRYILQLNANGVQKYIGSFIDLSAAIAKRDELVTQRGAFACVA